jgi:Putative prokaryotic signal transducing protein
MSGTAELVEVAFVGDEPEALMIQALLEERGIPSLRQQVAPSGPQLGYGLMNPGWGSQRVMVHAHRAEEARSLLADAEPESEEAPLELADADNPADAEGERGPRDYGLVGGYTRAFLVSFGLLALAFGVFMLLQAI